MEIQEQDVNSQRTSDVWPVRKERSCEMYDYWTLFYNSELKFIFH